MLYPNLHLTRLGIVTPEFAAVLTSPIAAEFLGRKVVLWLGCLILICILRTSCQLRETKPHDPIVHSRKSMLMVILSEVEHNVTEERSGFQHQECV